MVRAVVDGQFVLLSVELETAFGRAIRHPAYRAAQIAGIAGEVLLEIIEPQHNIANFAPAVGHVQLCNDGAEIGNLGDETIRVGQGEKVNAFTDGRFSKHLFADASFHARII
jgi:hypothetical protein